MEERTVVESGRRIRAGPGTRLNDLYEIDALIAVGGMGEVFRGHVIETGDPVAIKTIRPELAEQPQALALFRKEASALHTVHHGAVVRYYVFSVDRRLGLPYLAMEYVTGESLADRLKRGALDFESVEILRRRVAGGLQAAHEAGIVHRDVAPDNVILPDGDPARAKIIDFGIARSPAGQTVIGDGFAGKYAYVSPEQLGLQGGAVTPRSDIYSLGLVLAQASRGRPLDMGDSPAEFVARRSRVPDLAGVDARLEPLLETMLQPDPRRRPESMAAVEAWRPRQRPSAPATPAAAGRRRRLALVAGGGVLALAATVALVAWPPGRPEPGQGADPPLTERPAPPKAPPGDAVDQPAQPPAQPSAPPTPPPVQPQQDGRTEPGPGGAPRVVPSPPRMEDVAGFIRDYRAGPCFFLNPTMVGAREAQAEGYGVRSEPFSAFDAAFRSRFGFEVQIQLRQVEPGQCPVVELLAEQARAATATAPKMRLEGDRIRSGGELRGTVEFAEGQNLRLFLIEGDGRVHDLGAYLKRSGLQARFAVRLEKPAQEGWRSQLVVAVASREPLVPPEGGAAGTDAVIRALARAAAQPGGGVGLAVRYVKVGI